MVLRYPTPDSTIIADTFEERANEISEMLKSLGFPKHVSVHLLDKNEGSNTDDFENDLSEQLEAKRKVVVIMNCVSAVRHKILPMTLSIEEQVQNRTRKMLVTCISSRSVRKELQKREIPYQNTFLHISYDEGGRYLQKVADSLQSPY